MTCIFCQIANGEIPATFEYEDAELVAFRDLDPKAPHHILIVPKTHISTINDLTQDHCNLIGKMVLTAQSLAQKNGINESGYRLVYNVNKGGGQAVFHIHLHLLGGRPLNWPPG